MYVNPVLLAGMGVQVDKPPRLGRVFVDDLNTSPRVVVL